MRQIQALILEDELGAAEGVARLVRAEGVEAVVCSTCQAARHAVQERDFELAILDEKLPDGTGSDFFRYLREEGIRLVAIMLTGYPDLPLAVALTREGLFDYVVKPFAGEAFTGCVRRALLRVRTTGLDLAPGELVGRSAAWQEVCRLVRHAAAHPEVVVLLTGETGSGKDVTAHLIHQLAFGARSASVPMLPLSCANMSPELFDAELYGAEKGAYTGATHARPGLVGLAEGGTLFLDEIGDAPLAAQPKLLQFLDKRTYRRVGGTEWQRFAGRLLTATNKDLESEVEARRFRRDLFYRLDVLRIDVPPLRERKSPKQRPSWA